MSKERLLRNINGAEGERNGEECCGHIMEKARLEAFSDGVFGVAATLMILDIKAEGSSWQDAADVLPGIGLYALSFTYIGIYWTNHHQMLYHSAGVNGLALWLNLLLLFCLTLLPFTTRWMGDAFGTVSVAMYGITLLLPAISFTVLNLVLARITQSKTGQIPSELRQVVKGAVSTLMYGVGVGISFWQPWGGVAVYASVALMWVVPVIFNMKALRA